jgi:hypothetical protein
MRKILLATAVLGAMAVMPASPAIAHRHFPRKGNPHKGTQYYCIPPAGAQQTAEGAVSGTVALLSPYTPGSLAAAGGVTPTVSISGAGQLSITLTATTTTTHRHHSHTHTVLVGQGQAYAGSAGCNQLHINLTYSGRRLLQDSSTVTLDVTGEFGSRGRHRGQGMANATVTLS